MIWHPLSLSVVVVDAVALALLFRGVAISVRIVADWSPGKSTRRQIVLETAAETGVLAARAAFGLLILSTLLLTFAVSNVFPAIVPGAMCGTGVFQAIGAGGIPAFLFRILCLGILYLWFILDRLDRSAPKAPMTPLNAKIMLLAAPIAVMAVLQTFGSLKGLNIETPVDCCAMVYDRVSGGKTGMPGEILDEGLLLWSFGLLTGLLLFSGISGLLAQRQRFGLFSGAAAILAPAWGLVAATTVVRILSAYIYEVLHHHCPWCLFLPEHHAAGFVLFGLLGLAMIQAPAAYLAFRATSFYPEIAENGNRFARRTLGATVFLVAAVTAVALWPAIAWRVRYGVWMM